MDFYFILCVDKKCIYLSLHICYRKGRSKMEEKSMVIELPEELLNSLEACACGCGGKGAGAGGTIM